MKTKTVLICFAYYKILIRELELELELELERNRKMIVPFVLMKYHGLKYTVVVVVIIIIKITHQQGEKIEKI